MKRRFAESGLFAAFGAVPLLVVVLVFPGYRARALDAYVVYLGALLLLTLVRITAGEKERPPSLLEGLDREGPASGRIVELDRLERNVVLATGSELEQHVRIKPLLRDVVAHRLWTSRGVDLETSPERAQEIVGPELWELVKPDRPDPNARDVRGLDLAELGRVLDRIEAM